MIARLLNYEDTLQNKFLKFNQILVVRFHFFNYDQALLLPDLAPRLVISVTPILPDFLKLTYYLPSLVFKLWPDSFAARFCFLARQLLTIASSCWQLLAVAGSCWQLLTVFNYLHLALDAIIVYSGQTFCCILIKLWPDSLWHCFFISSWCFLPDFLNFSHTLFVNLFKHW